MVEKENILTDWEVIANLKESRQVDETVRFLYRQHFDYVSRYVLNNSGMPEDAEDIFQEVLVAFIGVVQKNKFRGEATIRTFLYTMNKHMWLNELKKRGRAQTRETKYEMMNKEIEIQVPDYMEQKQINDQLMKTMEALGETCKKILMLFYYENRSMKEILATLHYENEQVVRNKKHKCIKKLEEMVKGSPGFYQQLKSVFYG